MSEKILVFKDENEINRMVKCINEFNFNLNKIKDEYEALTKESFSNEVFKSILTDKGESVIEQYLYSVNKELDKIGVVNSITRDSLLNGHNEVITKFKDVVKAVLSNNTNSFGIVQFNYVTYNKGKFIITSESLKELELLHSIYLETKEEIELYNQLKDTFKTIVKTKEKIENTIGYKLPGHVKVMDLFSTYFFKEIDVLKFNPKEIKTFLRKFKR